MLDVAGARDISDVLEESDGAATHAEDQDQAPDPEPPHTIDIAGLLAEHLKTTGTAEIRDALRGGRTIRRGQGYSVRVTAPLALHQTVLGQCAALAGDGGTPAGRKAYRTYADRIAAVGNQREGGSLDRNGH